MTALKLEAPLFWSSLRQTNHKVAVIDVPDGYPVPGLQGIQVANWAPHLGWISNDPAFAPSSEPADLLREVSQVFGPQVHIIENHTSDLAEDKRLFQLLMQRVAKKGELCRHLLARDQFDLIVAVFSEAHTGNHQFWKYRPEISGADGSDEGEMSHATRDIYKAIDQQMAALLAQLPADANICVVSSVGMEDCYPTSGLAQDFCRKLGYQTPSGPAPLSLRAMPLLRRVVPEAWRIALSRHLPRDTRAFAFRPVSRRHRLAAHDRFFDSFCLYQFHSRQSERPRAARHRGAG